MVPYYGEDDRDRLEKETLESIKKMADQQLKDTLETKEKKKANDDSFYPMEVFGHYKPLTFSENLNRMIKAWDAVKTHFHDAPLPLQIHAFNSLVNSLENP